MKDKDAKEAAEAISEHFGEILETIEQLCLVVDQHEEEIRELHMILETHNEMAMQLIKGEKHGRLH
jgi:hypothetical protein